VLYSHAHPNNRIDRTFLRAAVRASIVRDARGLRLAITPF
jgi:hypothetical protein